MSKETGTVAAKIKPPDYWWNKEFQEVNGSKQWYDADFFKPYVDQLEPHFPADYKDPILESELAKLQEVTEDFPTAGPNNHNIPNLLRYYDQTIMPVEGKNWYVCILIPSAAAKMDLQCAVALSALYKPRHSIQTITGHNIGILRNQLVNMALDIPEVTHVFFLDDDTVIPQYALLRLLRRNLDIASGVYTMKVPPYVPLAIKRPRNIVTGEKKYNYYVSLKQDVLNRVFPVDGAGAGCLLIKREVLEKMGPPWFEVAIKQHGLSAIGEDIFFFDRAIEMGYNPQMDTSIQCEHSMGFVQYPRLFIQDHVRLGDESRRTVVIWNRNAILDSLNLPYFDPNKHPDLVKQREEEEAKKKAEGEKK